MVLRRATWFSPAGEVRVPLMRSRDISRSDPPQTRTKGIISLFIAGIAEFSPPTRYLLRVRDEPISFIARRPFADSLFRSLIARSVTWNARRLVNPIVCTACVSSLIVAAGEDLKAWAKAVGLENIAVKLVTAGWTADDLLGAVSYDRLREDLLHKDTLSTPEAARVCRCLFRAHCSPFCFVPLTHHTSRAYPAHPCRSRSTCSRPR